MLFLMLILAILPRIVIKYKTIKFSEQKHDGNLADLTAIGGECLNHCYNR